MKLSWGTIHLTDAGLGVRGFKIAVRMNLRAKMPLLRSLNVIAAATSTNIPPLTGLLPRGTPAFSCALVFLASVVSSSASILSVAGNDTLVGNRPSNLITNGSFEADGGVAPNLAYWATGTTLTPTMSLSGWTASGQSNSYAYWGSDGFGGIKSSATFPDGTNGVYFGAGIMAMVNPFPVEANNGLVTFTSTPIILPKPGDGPVTLQQTVTGLNPSATYLLDFWTSGENVGQPGLPVDGFFGLDITGEPRLYFAAPSGNGPIGPSQRYQVYFMPTASTVTFQWINWGHYNGPNGMSDEIVLDDVILNQVSNAAPAALDCACVTNIITTCPAVVPDLCVMFANCFGTNYMPGSCTQNFPPGMPLSAGTYPLSIQVMDLQSNVYNCTVSMVVQSPSPPPPLTVVCPTNKIVECNTAWNFDSPVVLSSCCGVTVTSSDAVISQTGCSEVLERTFTITDGCGNTKTCTQQVTTVDTTPPGRACGMNMVPNPSFERTTNCPNAISLLDYASPWFTPSDGTSDLFSPCAGPASYVSTPTNFAGVQVPNSGQCYAGAIVWTTYGLNTNNAFRDYREYLEVPLLAPLVGGQLYQVSFRVSRADNYHYAIAELGAYLSKLPLQTNGYFQNFPVTPQVENPSGNLLSSTNSWMLVQGTYVAFGGEMYLTIGNFRTDLNTTWTNINPAAPTPDYAYYYFDDVSVTMLCDPITNKTVQCGQPWIFDFNQTMALDNCSGMNVTVNTTTTTNGLCPKVIQRDWSLTDACGNSNFLTQTITIVDTNPPMLLCASGANLVPNPQFENKAYCPYFFSQVSDAAPWFDPTIATPDYLNTCATFGPVSIPNNWFGNEAAYSGNGYMGAFVYSVYGTNPVPGYREYIEAPLLAPLQAGMSYQVSFHVSLADVSGWAIANLGAHFSVGPLVNGSTQGPLNVVPQVANPPSNLLTNKNGWTLIQGTFTAAGGEDHITLGNFLDDASTTAVTNAYGTNHPYYYYDDVSVVPLCSFTNKTVACGTAWNFDTPLAYDECSGNNLSTYITSTTVSGSCPKVYTRVWTIYDACSNSITATQAVTEVGGAVSVNCGCLQDNAISLLTTNACQGVVPNLSVLSNSPCISNACGVGVTISQSPPAGTIVGPGTHNITVYMSSCSGVTSSCVLPFFVNAPQPVISCPANIHVIGCSNNSAIVNYSATATGNTGPIMYSPPSGSIFPIGTTAVTCTATSSCGGMAVCSFNVIVTPPPPRFGCLKIVIGIITFPPNGTARIIYLPDFPGGGMGVDFADLSGTSGMRFDLGAADKFTFSTWLDFNAPEGANFDLRLPPDPGTTVGTTLVSLHRTGPSPGRWDAHVNPQMVNDPTAKFQSIAIGTNGQLFSSITQNGAALATNDLLHLSPMWGATGAVFTVTVDCRTRELTLESSSDTSSSTDRKGWDGCIYGNGPRGSKTNKNARVILTPLTDVPQPPITMLDLVVAGLDTLAFDNPSITAARERVNDGHVTLIKAYDDAEERGVEFYSLGDGGGIETGLGYAANFNLHLTSLDTNGLPPQEQQFAIRGWPPGTTTNRPPPPVINLRLAPDSSGLGGVQLGADFADWGVSTVTLQLWNGTTLVSETNHVPAVAGGTFATLGGFPGILGCPGVGVLSLSDTNQIFVLSGLNCGSPGCAGTELRIIAEPSTSFTPPLAYTDLNVTIGQDMDYLIHRLQTTPACSPAPLHVSATSDSVVLSWEGDGFHLEGAESVAGPWYDLEMTSPATIPAGSAPRVFRLRCD